MRRILLMGYFGAGNFGDDALLANFLLSHGEWLKSRDLACDVISANANPLADFAEGPELAGFLGSCLDRRTALGMPLSGYCSVIAPGGSMLQDVTSSRSLNYYLLLLRRFSAQGKPQFLLNQGIGPIRGWINRWQTLSQLSRATFISVRDEPSMQWLERQAAMRNHPALLLSADPILTADFSPAAAALPQLPYALVIPRPTGDLPHRGDPTTEPEAIAEACTELLQCGLLPVLLPLHPAQDQPLCEAVQRAVPAVQLFNPVPPRANHIWSLIGGARLVLSYRLHGLIAAAANGVAGFGVAYDPKVESFCHSFALPWCYPAELHEPEALGRLRMLAIAEQPRRSELELSLDAARGRLDQASSRFRKALLDCCA